MAIGASQAGGTQHHGHAAAHSPLSAAEHHAASQVLAKLGLSSSNGLGRATTDSLAHSKANLIKPTTGTAGAAHNPTVHADKAGTLSGAKIGVAGATAASVKEHASHAAKANTTKMTASDKTSVHVSGVSVHDLTKGGHGSGNS